MTISSINSTSAANIAVIEPKTPPTSNDPVINKAAQPSKAETDKFKVTNEKVVSSSKPQINSNLQLDITDNNGFTNMGKSDINAKVSGEVTVTAEFILGKLSQMKSNESKKFYPPKFDAERKQYIISGKAMEAILGTFNVDFEIRLGEVNGDLAFKVDNGIKRGSIYSDLEKMLKELGVETYRKDKQLFIKPSYKDIIDIPISKDKTQKARIESLDTNSENTKVSIDKSGLVTIKLKDVKMTASTNPDAVTEKSAKPDVASVKFDFSLDDQMKPTINVKDGNIKADVNQKIIEKYVGSDATPILDKTIGTSMSVSLSKLSGNVKIDENGLKANVSTDLKVDSNTDDSEISANVKVSVNGKNPSVEAKNLDVKLKDGQQLNAESVKYSGSNGASEINASKVNAKVNYEGSNADVQGNIKVNLNGKDTAISFEGDTKGKIDKAELKSDFETHGKHDVKLSGKDISVSLDGTAKGKIDQSEIKADFETQGKHNVDVKANKINVNIDQMMAIGSFNKSSDKKVDKDAKESSEINIKVNKTDISGKADLGDIKLDASIKEGGLNVNIGKDVKIETDAQISATATGETVKGKVDLKGAKVDIKETGDLSVNAQKLSADGSFKNKNGLAVDGKVNGNVDVKVSNAGDIEVKTNQGNFDANFKKDEKIKVHGKGTDATFRINKKEDIGIDLKNVEAKTNLNLGNVKVNADTKGARVNVDVKGDDISIKTEQSKSTTELKVKENISAKGTTGDINVKVSSTKKGDDVKIDVKDADMKANIKNTSGKLNVQAQTKSDIKVHINEKEDISIASRNAKSTNVNFKLDTKVAADAKGKNFNVDIKGDDIDLKLKEAEFKGSVTPNEKIKINTATATKSDLQVKISDKKEGTDIDIATKSGLKGDVSIKDKINSEFNNKNGFKLSVKDGEKGSIIQTNLDDLNLKGKVDAGNAQVDMNGQGNFNIKIDDTQAKSDISIGYKGKLAGNADLKNTAKGNYDIDGKVGVNIAGDNVKVEADGNIKVSAKSDKFGIGADVKLSGDKNNKINVNINSANGTRVDAKITNDSYIEVKDINQLKLGNSDPTVTTILSKLKSKSAKVSYQNLEINNNAERVSVNVQAKDIKTEYGNLSTAMSLKKNGSRVQIERGVAVVQPNEALFKFITDEVSKKYNIKVTSTPEFKDGSFSLKGEIKTKSGQTQLADFNIKTTIVNNNLVLDIDKAAILKVVGQNTLNTVVNKVLNRTDIEHMKTDKNSISIKLDDLFKDLAMTGGVNFGSAKLEDDKIKIGFTYNSTDQDISKLAKKNDIAGIDKYLKENSYTDLSGEAISTAYSAYASSGDVNKASKMMVDVSKTFANPAADNKKEIARGLVWISKNQGVKKKNIDDDITLQFAKSLNLKTSQGQNVIKSLPTEVVKNLANNLDKTISQGGGFSLISAEERENANLMRRLKGLPENKAHF